ncbi:MAG: NAD-dependent epimerase/dehydratase family protein [Proteobacteria bacterium]|nr:NAD-dependent epimerase/dehydratase family protein [Pseudomonadota bacterium]
MNILVLGGDGFLGSYIVENLVRTGHEVTVFDRFPFGVTRNLEHLHGNIRLFSGEFANREDISKAMEGQEVVYHCISATNPASSWNDPFIEIDENVRHSIQFFEIVAQKVRKCKVVYLSSGGTVYGRHEGLINEGTVPKPFSPYGIGKLTIEHFLNYYQHNERLTADIYRIGNAFGPRQPMHCPQGVIAKWMDSILNGKELLVYGDSMTVRDYIYVNDIARIVSQSVDRLANSGTYNVGSGYGISITELLETFQRVVDHPFTHRLLPRREFDNVSVVLDISRLLGQCPEFIFSDFQEKLSETWNYVKQKKGETI